MPAAASKSSALAPMPGTVRSGGAGCGRELLLDASEDELRREDEAAAQATEEAGGREKKGAKVWRDPIDDDENDGLRSALAPREGTLLP